WRARPPCCAASSPDRSTPQGLIESLARCWRSGFIRASSRRDGFRCSVSSSRSSWPSSPRINVRLIRAKIGWFRDVNVGEMHIHHVVFGVVLMLGGGVAGLILSGGSQTAYAVAASVFGVGAALVLDEFALILHLHDVYWEEEGRTS